MKKEKLEKILVTISNNKKIVVIIGAVAIFISSLLMYFLSVSTTIIISTAVFSSSFLFLIYFSVDYGRFVEIQKAEKNYPDFLEDLAEAKSSGMNMDQAIKSCTGGQYGALMPYIIKLNTHMSWGMPFNKAWIMFSKSLSDSKVMSRFNTIILEAIQSGADTAAILSSLATRAGTIRSIEDTRRGVMRQQVVMMYIIYTGFIGIIILLKRILLPTLFIQNMGVEGVSGIIDSAAGGGSLTADYFKRLFMMIILAQSISSGALIGQILEDKLIGGIKHIAILLGIGFFTYFAFIYPISIEVNQFISNNEPYPGEEINIGGTVNVDGSPGIDIEIQIEIDKYTNMTLSTGSQGRYYKEFKSPTQTGTYQVTTKIEYQGKTKVVQEYLNVK